MSRLIALTGFMGAGKSTIGKRLAKRLGLPFYDLDALIIQAHGPIAKIFASQGELNFRLYEFEALKQIVDRDGRAVVALGGGAVTYAPTRDLLQLHAYRIFIKLSVAKLIERLRRSNTVRPLLGATPRASQVRDLYLSRVSLYEEAQLTVDTGRLTPARAVDRIVEALHRDRVIQ